MILEQQMPQGQHLKGQMIELDKMRALGKGDSELTKKLDKEAERKAANKQGNLIRVLKKKVCQNG